MARSFVPLALPEIGPTGAKAQPLHPARQRGKLGVLLHPCELDLASRTVPVLAHDDLGDALVIRLRIVIFVSI